MQAVLFVALFSMAAGIAYADSNGTYLYDFEVKYPDKIGTDLDSCTLCHPFHPMSDALNSFGSDFAYGGYVFDEALGGLDSDNDTFTNIQEISAGTFPGDDQSKPSAVVTLTGLTISGPDSVNEGATASYAAWASWSDNTTTQVAASWAVSPPTVAMIDASGELTALAVASNEPATVSASYTDGDITRTASFAVTIVNVPDDPPPPPSGDELSLYPANGTQGVPVSTVVTIATDGSKDILSVVDPDTFTLTVADPGAVAAASEAATCIVDGVVSVAEPGYNEAGTEVTFTPLCDLAFATTYAAAIDLVSAGDPSAAAQTIRWTFTTVAQTSDSDGDGVQDGEDDYPHDNGKATPPSPRGTGKFLVDTCGNAGIGLAQCVALIQAEGISDMYPQFNRRGRPFGFDFPDGLVRYTLTGLTPGATVTVAVTFPSGVPFGSRVFKIDADGFHEVLDAVVDGERVIVTLTDGGTGDADGVANGVIVDPIGVAVPAAGVGSIDVSTTAPGSAGCSMASSGGDRKEVFGSFGLIALAGLVLALMRRKTDGGA